MSVLEAAQSAANASNGAFEVTWAQGVQVNSLDTTGIADAVRTAKAADVAVVVVGDSAEGVGYDGSASCGEGADRPSLDLGGVQLDLIQAVLATGTPTVVVLVHGRPVSFGEDHGGAVTSKFGTVPMYSKMAGLVAAWRPGVEGGHAIWSLLTGEAAFSGRLAQAWPHNAGAVHFGGISPWFEKACSEECPPLVLNFQGTLDPSAPAFPFGYGLDYLQTSYSAFAATLSPDKKHVVATVVVENAAKTAGQTVLEVYFTPPVCRLTRYRKMLGGFTKVHVPAAGSVEATITFAVETMGHWDPKKDAHVVDNGSYAIMLCKHSASDCKTAAVLV